MAVVHFITRTFYDSLQRECSISLQNTYGCRVYEVSLTRVSVNNPFTVIYRVYEVLLTRVCVNPFTVTCRVWVLIIPSQ